MLIGFVFIFFLTILVLNIYVFNYKKQIENFTINDYYDKYFNAITIPTDFYNISKLPKKQYAYEMHDRFFLDTLEKNKTDTSISFNDKDDINNSKLILSMLNRTNKYIVDILNKDLPLDERFLFANIFSEKILAKKLIDEVYVLKTNHIIYRDTKIYGVSLTITTIHSFVDKGIKLIDYKLDGYVFEDKLNPIQPSNLIDNDYQDYKKDKIEIHDPKYEKQYLCQYYNDLKKFRGITAPNIKEFNCPQTQENTNGSALNQ
jgi:hypothetical protein